MRHILIVDDDREIRELLTQYLERNDFHATAVADGAAMRSALKKSHYDLLVLDLMLPGEDGLTLCRDLRAHSTLPVIMLTARGDETDRIVGLEMGADDYLPKPFNPRELLARIKSVLRRSQSLPPAEAQERNQRYLFSGWTLDTTTRQLTSPQGILTPLSSSEYTLLLVFVSYPNHVLSREQLLDKTKGRNALPFDRSIDVQVGRLRRRLHDNAEEPVLIKTVRGKGYVFASKVESLP